MEAVAALGIASNVVQFVDGGAKLFSLIKEYSSHLGAPKELAAVSKRLELTLELLRSLDDGRKATLDREVMTMRLCHEQIKDLTEFIERLSIGPGGSFSNRPRRFSILSIQRSQPIEKAIKALTTMRSMEKFRQLQASLDRLLHLVNLEQQNRIAAATTEIRERTQRTEHTMYNTQELIRGLQQVRMMRNPVQTAAQSDAKTSLKVFMVPLPRNSAFLGRGDVVAQLEARLTFSEPADKSQSRAISKAALCGLGGIGKSQIALEYVYRKRDEIANLSVFWLHSSTPARFEEAYKRIAAEFEIPGWTNDRLDPLQLVHDFLESRYKLPWLMVIDNVDDTRIFELLPSGKSTYEYIPRIGLGTILFTSRSRDVSIDLAGDPILVPPLPVEDARQLLQLLNSSSSTLEEQNALLEEIDCLPLAINQAASFMLKRRKTISQYLSLLRDSGRDMLNLLEFSFSDSARESSNFKSIAATWFISFSQIKAENPRAANLLLIMSFFDRQDIPEELLISETESSFEFCQAVGILESYSFIQANQARDGFSMHRLVHATTRAWVRKLEISVSSILQLSAFRAMASRFPSGDFENWNTCARYLPQAETILSGEPIEDSKELRQRRAAVLFRTGHYQSRRQEFDQARHKINRCLKIYREIGLAHSPDALRANTVLGCILHRFVDDWASAIALLQETLQRQEQLLGQDHPHTLETISQLVDALVSYGSDVVNAESMCRRLIAAREQLHGPDHMLVVQARISLGQTLNGLGRYREAEALFRACADHPALRQGRPNPEAVSVYAALATVLADQEKHAEALEFLRLAIAASVALFGETSNFTLSLQVDLCNSLYQSDRLVEAEQLTRKTLPLCEEALGPNRFTTVSCISMLNWILDQKQSYDESEALLREQIRRRGVDVDADVPLAPEADMAVALLVGHLGDHYGNRGRNVEAVKLLESVWLWSKTRRGERHPRTAEWLAGLSKALQDLGDLDRAEDAARQSLAITRESFGEGHSQSLFGEYQLGQVLHSRSGPGQLAEAAAIFRRAAEKRTERFGPESHITANSLQLLGEVRQEQGEFADADHYYRAAACVRDKLGLERTASYSWDCVAEVLYLQEKWSEAIDVWKRLLEAKRRSLPDGESSDTLLMASNISSAFWSIDRFSEATRSWYDDVIRRSRDYYVLQKGKNKEEAADAIDREVLTRGFYYGPLHPNTRLVDLEQSEMFREHGRLNEAEEALQRTFDYTEDFVDLALTERAKVRNALRHIEGSENENRGHATENMISSWTKKQEEDMTGFWTSSRKRFYDAELGALKASFLAALSSGGSQDQLKNALNCLVDYWDEHVNREVTRWKELRERLVAFYEQVGKYDEAAEVRAKQRWWSELTELFEVSPVLWEEFVLEVTSLSDESGSVISE